MGECEGLSSSTYIDFRSNFPIRPSERYHELQFDALETRKGFENPIETF